MRTPIETPLGRNVFSVGPRLSPSRGPPFGGISMGSERGETGNSTELKEKIRTLKSELEQQFVERDDEIAGALLGLLAGEPLLFLGPPGTAKSLLATKVCDAVDGGRFFYYLLTRFTTPDEVFGPLSIKSLQEDRFHRVTDKALPAADIAFLDEIFKA